MRRPLVYLSLLLVLVLAGTAVAGLSSSDKKILKRHAGRFLNPDEDDGKRDEGRQKFLAHFQKGKKAKDLKDVDALTEILADAGERERIQTGVSSREITSELEKTEGMTFKYTLSVPKKYKPDGPSWPLIYCVPEKGQTASEYLDKYWLSPLIRDSFIIVALDFDYSEIVTIEKEHTKDEDGVVGMVDKKVKVPFTWKNIRPQTQFWLTLLTVMIKDCKVDPNRVILDGAGLGSTGNLAMIVGQPWRFAGIIVRGGAYEGDNLANVKPLKVLAMPLATAGEDATKTSGALKTICEGNFAVGSNEPKWSGAKEEGTEMLAWLTAAVRDRYPVPVSWTFVEDTDEIGYWFYVKERYDDKLPAKVTLEAKGNEVTLKTENVKKLDLYLNDVLVNLDKPFKLKVNDEDARTIEVTRKAEEVLLHAFAGGGKRPHDLGCVFVAEVEDIAIEPPAAKKDDDKKDGE